MAQCNLNDYPVDTSSISAEVVTKGRKKLKAKDQNSSYGRCCFFSLLTTGEQATESMNGNAGCHGGLFYATQGVAVIGNAFKVEGDDTKVLIEFLRTDPFISRCLLNRDTIEEDGGILITADIPTHFVHYINLITRITNEHRSKLPLFAKYVRDGIDPIIAIFLAENVNLAQPAYIHNVISHGYLFGTNLSLTTLKNIINRDVQQFTDKKFNTGNSFYTGTSAMFGIGPTGSDYYTFNFIVDLLKTCPDLREQLSSFRKKKEGDEDGKSSIINPFLRKTTASITYKTNPGLVTVEEWEKIIYPFIVESKELSSK